MGDGITFARAHEFLNAFRVHLGLVREIMVARSVARHAYVSHGVEPRWPIHEATVELLRIVRRRNPDDVVYLGFAVEEREVLALTIPLTERVKIFEDRDQLAVGFDSAKCLQTLAGDVR